jgi:hypothetical protein
VVRRRRKTNGRLDRFLGHAPMFSSHASGNLERQQLIHVGEDTGRHQVSNDVKRLYVQGDGQISDLDRIGNVNRPRVRRWILQAPCSSFRWPGWDTSRRWLGFRPYI